MKQNRIGKNKNRRDKGTAYLEQYPQLMQWMNQCAIYQALGYKPDLPDNIYPWFNVGADNLRRFYDPLDLNDLGLCEQCAQAFTLLDEGTTT